MNVALELEREEHLAIQVSPRLVAANAILALSTEELLQTIAEEVNENPALDVVEVPVCPVCGAELQGHICPSCIQRQKGEADLEADGYPWADYWSRDAGSDDDHLDPFAQAPAEETLAEKLLRELGTMLPEADMPIAEYLVGSLDENGYLKTTVRDAALELEVDEGRVQHVLQQLQSLEPVGIGARNLRECLLIQLDYLERTGIRQRYAREIISDYLPELAERKFAKIARKLKVSLEEVAQVLRFIRSEMKPHPADGFSATNAHHRDTLAMYVTPAVVISKGENGFEVEVVESERFRLRVNPAYTRLNSEVRRSGAGLTPEEQQHVRQRVHQARTFIQMVNQRRQTLLDVTRHLVAHQKEFLEKGARYLKPMTRAAIAAEMGVHESTVSRALASKYVMLPWGEVMPFSQLFISSLPVREVISEMIKKEKRPITDAEIAGSLRERGIKIARRTVCKYRQGMGILPASIR